MSRDVPRLGLGESGVDGSIVVQKIKDNEGTFGFNAATEAYGNMLDFGIIAPTKVVRHALQNAASVAAHVLGCEETARFESEFRREPGRGAAGGWL